MTTICAWFARCTNETTTALPHPVLGLTPCCTRCATVVDEQDRLVAIAAEVRHATYLVQHVLNGEVIYEDTVTGTAKQVEASVAHAFAEGVIACDDERFDGPGTWQSGAITWERLG